MEKRFLLFLLLAFVLLMGNVYFVALLNRDRQVADGDGKTPKTAATEKSPKQQEDGKTESAVATAGKTAKTKTGDPPKEKPPAAEKPPAVAARPQTPPEYVTLGSLDLTTGYRMLVTLTNQGAGIRRIELGSERYRDLHDRGGYLGHLELQKTDGGLRVDVVGAGTPAQAAGLQVGDVIASAGGEALTDAASLREILARHRPGNDLELSGTRVGAALSLTVMLTRRPLDVIRPERENYWMRSEPVPADLVDTPSLLISLLDAAGDEQVEIAKELVHDGSWEVGTRAADGTWSKGAASGDAVTFRLELPGESLVLYKTFRLDKAAADSLDDPNAPAYDLTLAIEIENTGGQPRKVAYRLDGPNGLPVEGWWYASKISPNWSGSGLRDFVVQYEGQAAELVSAPHVVDYTEEKEKKIFPANTLKYIGVDAQYFSAVVMPADDATRAAEFVKGTYNMVGPKVEKQVNLTNVTFEITSTAQTLAPADQDGNNGGRLVHRFELFAGPKKPDLVAHYGLDDLIYYGWFWWVAKPMLLVLHLFYAVVRNYGISIILLTVLVRSCMFPLSKKQALGAQKMQQLQPELKKLHEKYGKDMEKKMKAQRELFRKHNYNPMGGCLLVFFQLPIFIGLYRSLMVDIELRQAPLLGDAIRWCSNLSAPDMLIDWSLLMPGFVVGFLGPFFNVLPIITITIWIVQQKMFMPPPTDEQSALQQKIMKYMMIFMGFLFYRVAAGLCLYFVASSLWSICERKLLPKTKPAGADAATSSDTAKPAAKSPAKHGSNGADQARRRRQRRR